MGRPGDQYLPTGLVINLYYSYHNIKKILVFPWPEIVEWCQLQSYLKEQQKLFSEIIINSSSNLESIFIHKSLDTIYSSFIIKNFISGNLFLKTALVFSQLN